MTPQIPPNRVVVVGAVLAFSWLWLQWTHEAGHVLAGLATNADLDRVVLDPRTFSRTDFIITPRPLITVWSGPIIGCLLGAGIPLIMTTRSPGWQSIGASIAAVVLLGNGAYIGLGAFMPVGDAEVMRDAGTPSWILASFGIVCAVLGRICAKDGIRPWRDSTDSPTRATVTLIAFTIPMAAIGWIFFPA
ncbi:MAG: hypothetical protein AB8F26_01370 [Phycisphaerales bacterium]